MSAPIFTNNGDFATRLASAVQLDLMAMQADPTSNVESTATTVVTDPLLPDRMVTDRLAHFDPDLYDLSESSHLMRLLNVLLGGAGAGGIRKQIAVARLQNSFSGMHFLDLDRFYGALFGIRRTQAELMPDFGTLDNPAVFDPYTDAAGSDAWDDVHSRDASYRARLIKFVRALPLGGTYAGLRAAAEALLSVDCEVYESWSWVDEQDDADPVAPVLVYTYAALGTKNPTWGVMDQDQSWASLNGGVNTAGYFLGRTGQKNRSEVVIQPKRRIETSEGYTAMRVLDRIKPAGAQITVDPEGLAIHQPVAIRGVSADSEYWEINYTVDPAPALVSPDPAEPVYQGDQTQVRPALSGYQGESANYNNEIAQASSYQMLDDVPTTTTNYATLVFKDGSTKAYITSLAIMDGQKVLAGRVVADGVMTSFAYAKRVTAVTIKNGTKIKVKK